MSSSPLPSDPYMLPRMHALNLFEVLPRLAAREPYTPAPLSQAAPARIVQATAGKGGGEGGVAGRFHPTPCFITDAFTQ